jgi:hypothetical protein
MATGDTSTRATFAPQDSQHDQPAPPTIPSDTQRNKKVWVQNVAVNASILQARLEALRARRDVRARRYSERLEAGHPPNEELEQRLAADAAVDKRVQALLGQARDAALGKEPLPRFILNWWSGRLIEAAYQNLHAAEALIAVLYDRDEIQAEVPEAVARVEAQLDRDDPRRSTAAAMLNAEFKDRPVSRNRVELAKTIEVGHAGADRDHSRLRSFRNTVLASAGIVAVLVIVFAAYVSRNHDQFPLCFTPQDPGGGNPLWVCPTHETQLTSSRPLDDGATDPHVVVVVALLGLLCGWFSAAVAIKNLTGTSTPYDVPLALALLKLPLGALTAIGVLIALQGDFVPGLSELDSQGQILAYALVFGYAQQLLTGLLDRRAESLLATAPGKEKAVERPIRPTGAAEAARPKRRRRSRKPQAQPEAAPATG